VPGQTCMQLPWLLVASALLSHLLLPTVWPPRRLSCLRLHRSTLQLYAARVEALASQLQPADIPAFCKGVSPQPGAAALLQQPQPQPQQRQVDGQSLGEERQQQQDRQGSAAEAAAGRTQAANAAAAAARLVVPAPPGAVARTPQLPAKATLASAGVQQQGSAAAAAAASRQLAGAALPTAGPASGRLQTQQQLHERAAAGNMAYGWLLLHDFYSLLCWPTAWHYSCSCAPVPCSRNCVPTPCLLFVCPALPLLQEDLTEDLAGLAAQLKSNTLAIEGRLKERGQLLDSTEAALDTSVQVGSWVAAGWVGHM